MARIDFRIDDQGRIFFIECNPLPGLTPGWSDLVLISQAAGIEYRALIGEILSNAIRRYQERERERERARRAHAAAEREAAAVANGDPHPTHRNGNGTPNGSAAGNGAPG